MGPTTSDTFEAITDLAGRLERCTTGDELAALLPEVSEALGRSTEAGRIALLGNVVQAARTEEVLHVVRQWVYRRDNPDGLSYHALDFASAKVGERARELIKEARPQMEMALH